MADTVNFEGMSKEELIKLIENANKAYCGVLKKDKEAAEKARIATLQENKDFKKLQKDFKAFCETPTEYSFKNTITVDTELNAAPLNSDLDPNKLISYFAVPIDLEFAIKGQKNGKLDLLDEAAAEVLSEDFYKLVNIQPLDPKKIRQEMVDAVKVVVDKYSVTTSMSVPLTIEISVEINLPDFDDTSRFSYYETVKWENVVGDYVTYSAKITSEALDKKQLKLLEDNANNYLSTACASGLVFVTDAVKTMMKIAKKYNALNEQANALGVKLNEALINA